MNITILKYIFFELLRSRFVISYAVFLAAISAGVAYFSNDELKTSLTLLNVVLFIVPLVSLIFGSIHFYDSEEFIEFLLTQPISRNTVFRAEFLALASSLSIAAVAGLIPALILNGISSTFIFLLFISASLSFIFTGLAFLSSSMNSEKVRGIGLSIIIWLLMSVLFDLIVVLLIVVFSNYPLERFIIIVTALNPIDLGRILILLKTDASAMMGFTGASFKDFFGSTAGMIASAFSLVMWALIPYLFAIRTFRRKNF
ncbi:MAG: ABC transporter permease [Ignavibacteria bacterium]|nr:ABC transporter permease [Ignavibacteria bacterium]